MERTKISIIFLTLFAALAAYFLIIFLSQQVFGIKRSSLRVLGTNTSSLMIPTLEGSYSNDTTLSPCEETGSAFSRLCGWEPPWYQQPPRLISLGFFLFVEFIIVAGGIRLFLRARKDVTTVFEPLWCKVLVIFDLIILLVFFTLISATAFSFSLANNHFLI